MNIKEWLSRAYKIDQQIKSKYEQVEAWENLAQKITGDISALPIRKNGITNRIEIYSVKIADAKAEIKKQMGDLVDAKREIAAGINKVENITSRILLEQRYLLCKCWDDIAEFMGYDVEYTRRGLHKHAIKEIRLLLSE